MNLPHFRESLRSACRQDANRVIEDQRYREGVFKTPGYFDQPCSQCGNARSYKGDFTCPCEEARFEALKAEYEVESWGKFAAKALEWARIPPRYADCTFQTFQPRPGTEEALEAARAWVEGYATNDGGLFLSGPVGTGKSHLGIAALRQAIQDHLPTSRFVTAHGLTQAVRGKGPALDWEPLELASEVPLLLLDDISQLGGTDLDREILQRVVFSRYENDRSTLITTNAGPRQLSERIGAAVVSRISEMCITVTVTGADFRRTKRGLGVA